MKAKANGSLAPVALFVYNRLDNTRRTIEALQRNTLAAETELYIFSDGGKDDASWLKVNQLRDYLKTVDGFAETHLMFRPENFYLERNIIEGVTQTIERHGRIIVLEDDIVTAPHFLEFMNDALDFYEKEKKVWHVTGFSNLCISNPSRKTFLSHHMAGWGWGTWADRWQNFQHFSSRQEALQGLSSEQIRRLEFDGSFPCLKSLDRSPIPWDICWGIALCKADALALYPSQTLVRNIGLSQGTHFAQMRIFGWYEYDRQPFASKIPVESIPIAETSETRRLLRKALTDHGMRYNLLGKIVRRIYLFVRKGKKRGE